MKMKSKITKFIGFLVCGMLAIGLSGCEATEYVKNKIQSAVEQVREIKAQISQLTEMEGVLDAYIEELETHLATLTECLAVLQEEVIQNKQEIASLKQTIEDLQNEINCLKGNHVKIYVDNLNGTHTLKCLHCEYADDATTATHIYGEEECTLCGSVAVVS